MLKMSSSQPKVRNGEDFDGNTQGFSCHDWRDSWFPRLYWDYVVHYLAKWLQNAGLALHLQNDFCTGSSGVGNGFHSWRLPMNKLTAEKCREQIEEFQHLLTSESISTKAERHLQAYRIALPILEQQERGEGDWIEWGGGDTCPVPEGVKAEIKFRDGDCAEIDTWLDILEWRHKGYGSDIIAYRIIPERATNQIIGGEV
jgi:hypothetical protein